MGEKGRGSAARRRRRGDGRLFPPRPPPRPRRRRRRATAGGGTATLNPCPRKRPCGAKRTPPRGRRPAARGRRVAEKVQRCQSSAPHVIKPSSANIALKCTTGKRSDFSFPLRSRVGTCAARLCPFPPALPWGGGQWAIGPACGQLVSIPQCPPGQKRRSPLPQAGVALSWGGCGGVVQLQNCSEHHNSCPRLLLLGG